MAQSLRQDAINALLDEYQRALLHLKQVIENINDADLTKIIDAETEDDNCRSIQTILSHVVHSGLGYATSIHNHRAQQITRPARTFHTSIKNYLQDLDNLFLFTEKVLKEMDDMELEQFDNSLKIKTGWGQLYDPEQLIEHAIVHILRHRRQIERIKLNKLKGLSLPFG